MGNWICRLRLHWLFPAPYNALWDARRCERCGHTSAFWQKTQTASRSPHAHSPQDDTLKGIDP